MVQAIKKYKEAQLMPQASNYADYKIIDERSLSVAAWRYTGERIKLTGQVTNISCGEQGTWLTLRIGLFPRFVTVVVRYAQSFPELKKDMTATVFGVCSGTERVRYQSEDFMGFISLMAPRPLIKAEHIEYDGVYS